MPMMITKKLLAIIMFATSVMVNGVPISLTDQFSTQPFLQQQQQQEEAIVQQPILQQVQQDAVPSVSVLPLLSSSLVGSNEGGLPSEYPGFATIQPIASNEVDGQLQYNTEPILQQLRGMSSDSNFGRLGR
jgi:hypothetical protein